jgi:hypothetical protein
MGDGVVAFTCTKDGSRWGDEIVTAHSLPGLREALIMPLR